MVSNKLLLQQKKKQKKCEKGGEDKNIPTFLDGREMLRQLFQHKY